MFSLEDHPDFIKIVTRFPHLRERLTVLWGTFKFTDAVNQLLLECRPQSGKRNAEGFPHDVANAFVHLMVLHDEMYPETVIKTGGPWGAW